MDDLKGFFTPFNEYYESTAPIGDEDTMVPLRPDGDEYFFHAKLGEWAISRRSQDAKIVHKFSLPKEHLHKYESQPQPVVPEPPKRRASDYVTDQRRTTDSHQHHDKSGYSWSIKELLPFIITLLLALSSLVGVYVKLNNQLIIAEQDVMTMKIELNDRKVKMAEIFKNTDAIKTQLTELNTTVLLSQRTNKR